MWKPASMLVLLLATNPAPSAEIRKCKDPATGKVVYTDTICPAASEQQHLEIHDNRVGALPPGLMQPLSTHSEPRPAPSASPARPPAPSTGSTVAPPMNRSHY